jgi:hypothetical protein
MRTPDGVMLKRSLPIFFRHTLILISNLTQVLPGGLFSSHCVPYWLSLEVSVCRLRGFDHQGLRCSSVKGLHFGARVCLSIVIGVRVSHEDCI